MGTLSERQGPCYGRGAEPTRASGFRAMAHGARMRVHIWMLGLTIARRWPWHSRRRRRSSRRPLLHPQRPATAPPAPPPAGAPQSRRATAPPPSPVDAGPKIKVGGQLRLRSEYRDACGRMLRGTTDALVGQRARATRGRGHRARARPGRGADARNWGMETSRSATSATRSPPRPISPCPIWAPGACP